MNEDTFGIRPGEVKTELPEKFDAGVYFIGRIRTPWTKREECPKNARESDALCTIEVDARFAGALAGVETCSHLLVLYWMDKSRRDLVLQVPRNRAATQPSPASGGGKGRGTFALRSPARPNPIAASVVRLAGVEGNRLSVVGLDCLDGTPLIDLKPYFASTDAVPDAVVGWHQEQKT
jgi:tRNA-Thr(GGU) m(6)t(6)A37 methyltransferase TsaA